MCILVGCGGSGGGGSTLAGGGSSDSGSGGGGGVVQTGRVSVSLDWPAYTRQIPDYAKSVVLAISLPGSGTPLESKIVDRSKNDAYSQTVEFSDLPAGSTVLECKAMTEPGGEGTMVGSFSTGVTVVANGKAAVQAAIDTEVAGVAISNAPATLEVGKGVVLLAHGLDDQDKALTLPNDALKWTLVSGMENLELLANGTASGVKEGTAIVKVTEISSGASNQITITVVPSSVPGGGEPDLTGAKFVFIRNNLAYGSALYIEDVATGDLDHVIDAADPRFAGPDLDGIPLFQNAHLSADGSKIVLNRTFFTKDNLITPPEIYTLNADGTNLVLLLESRVLTGVNPDCSTIIASGYNSAGVHIVSTNGGGETLIPGTVLEDHRFTNWTSDGKYYLRGRPDALQKVDIATGQVVQDYTDRFFGERAVFSPNQGSLLMMRYRYQPLPVIDWIIWRLPWGPPLVLAPVDRFNVRDELGADFTPDGKGVIRYMRGSTPGDTTAIIYRLDGTIFTTLALEQIQRDGTPHWDSYRDLWQPQYGMRPGRNNQTGTNPAIF